MEGLPYEEVEVYPPNLRMSSIEISAPEPLTPKMGKGKQVDYRWAQGTFLTGDKTVSFTINKQYSHEGDKAAVLIESSDDREGYEDMEQQGTKKRRNLVLNGLTLRKEGSRISFGIKWLRDYTKQETSAPVALGFDFVRLELLIWNRQTGEERKYLVVGVKLPEMEDVASAFILSQRIFWPRNHAHVVHRIGILETSNFRRNFPRSAPLSGREMVDGDNAYDDSISILQKKNKGRDPRRGTRFV